MKFKTKRIIRTGLFSFIGVLVIASIAFIIWANNPLKSQIAASAALVSDSRITVTISRDRAEFSPSGLLPEIGFIFYPGAHVDWRAYAPVIRLIAEHGYLAVIVPLRLNLAIFDVNAAATVIASHSEIKHWAIGGHSLGGVAAAIFTTKNPESVAGLALWASYPVDDSLLHSQISIASIYGTLDGLATPEKIAFSRLLLPETTVWYEIEGGNHAGFGDYGAQPGDNTATIPKAEQWNQTVFATVAMLKKFEFDRVRENRE